MAMSGEMFFDLPLVAGLDEANREESRDPSTGWKTLENVEQRKRGAFSKRKAVASLGSAGSSNAAVCLAPHRDSALTMHDGRELFVYGGTSWTSRGRIPMLSTTRTPLVSAGVFRGTTVYEVAQSSGVLVVAYETARALYAMVLDATTFAPILGPTKIAAGLSGVDALQEFRMSMVVVGTTAFLVYNRENFAVFTREDSIEFATLDCTNPAGGWTLGTLIGAGLIDLTPGAYLFDLCGLSDRLAILYRDVFGAIKLGTYTAAGVNIATASAFAGAPGATLSFSVDGTLADTLWLSRCDTGTNPVGVEAHDPTTLAVTGAAIYTAFPNQLTGSESSEQIYNGALVRTGAATAKLVVTGATTSAGDYVRNWIGWQDVIISAGAVARSGNASISMHLEGTHKPFVRDGRVLSVVVPFDNFDAANPAAPIELQSATNLQRCMYVVDVTDPRLGDVLPYANVAPRVNGTNGMFYLPRYVRQMAIMPDGANAILFPSLRSPTTEVLELAEFRPLSQDSTAEVGGTTCHAGGVAWSYDGNRPLESSYLQTPRVKATPPVVGSLTGSFAYVAVWEHEDSAGNVHFSSPSPPITVALAAQSGRVRITTPTASFRALRSTGADRVRCVLYRTSASGGTYYRCAEADAYDPASTNQSAFQAFTDDMLDATLTQRAKLYTQPGALGTSLPRRSPPGLVHVVQHGDQLAGIADDRRTIWFSAPRVGGEGTWWQDLFIAEVEDVSPLVALASFDARLVAFTRSGIWMIDGTGFAENGGGGFSIPQRVPSDVGCSDARSLVVIPQGALFLSDLGICLLSRSGQVSYFGEQVAETLATYPEVTSAVLEADEGRVLFSLSSATGAGAWLVYDYVTGVWTTHRRKDLAKAHTACALGGRYHYAGATCDAHRVASTNHLDDGVFWVGQTIETGWIRPSGLQGYQAIRRLLIRFARRSAFELRVSLGYDYEDTYEEIRDFDQGDIDGMPSTQIEISPARRKCQAIRVKLQELEPVSTELASGQGFELVGLRFAYVAKRRPGFSASQKG